MCSTAELVHRVGAALATLDEPETGVGASLAADYVALRRLVDRLEVLGLRWLAALDDTRVGAVDGSASTAAWVRRRSGCSARAAAADVRLARRLHTDQLRPLTTTTELLETGRLTLEHARAIARATASLDPAAHQLAEPTIAAASVELGVDPATGVAHAVADHAAELHATGSGDPAATRRAAATANRRLHLSRCGESWALDGLLTLEAGTALQEVLAPFTVPRPEPDGTADLRTAGQRRADALGEVARRLLAGDGLPTNGGRRPQLTLLVELGTGISGLGSGRFADGGRLSPAATERLACDAEIDWVATGSPPGRATEPTGTTGIAAVDGARVEGRDLVRRALRQIAPAVGGIPSQVLDAGRSRRLVNAAQRRALTIRDRGCVFPGCDRPPDCCDAHHLTHWSHGGNTDLHNLALLRRRHHVTVHDGGWSLNRAQDGTVTAHPPP